MPAKRIPVTEITNPSGIAHAIRAREVKRRVAQIALDSGMLNGRRVTTNRRHRLDFSIAELDRELSILYAKRDALPSASKSTAQGAPSAKLEDWE